MISLKVRYDGDQHITAKKEPYHNVVEIDCPYTGQGEEFSPASLLSISLASCMLLSMGAVAQRDGLDLRGTVADVSFKGMEKRFPHVDEITMIFDIPKNFMPSDRKIVSNASVNFLSRSRIRKRKRLFVSSRFHIICRACWVTQVLSGFVVQPAK